MLPLIPALILLLLQGPANVERMTHDGGLPAALQAIHLRMEQPRKLGNGEVLASLIAVSGDPQLCRALCALLSINDGEEQSSVQPLEPAPTSGPLPDFQVVRTQEGFRKNQRSRDGPC